jgi:acyl dehydratase
MTFHPQLMAVITLEMLKKFAVASGDHNPIHQDEAVAQSMGLQGVIAHGMLISSLVLSRALIAIEATPELKGRSITQTQTRFRAMTFLGDEIFVSGKWEPHASGIKLDLVAKNQRDETVITATLEVT